jgi:DNA-binding NtrC family response regulator
MQSNTKILIVEDQFVEANHLRLMLKKAGYTITGIARSVDDARQKIAAEKPGLVLLDIFLSGKETGIDLARCLREENIAFIYLSANSNEPTLNAAKATQPYGFLVKPFREKDLLVALEIARYHIENGIESAMRKETLFQKQLKALVSESGTWDDRLLKIGKALQPLLPFDYMVVIHQADDESPNNVLGFLRIGYDEYQKIGMDELQTISKLKLHEIKTYQDNTHVDTAIKLYAGETFEQLCRKLTMKKLIADSFGMQANLTLPVPTELNKGRFFFSFFSQKPHGFDESHVALCERLQQPLIYAVEHILARDKKAFAKTTVSKPVTATATAKPTQGFEGIIGKSPLLLTVFDQIMQVASSDTSVLIMGESGTGKERIADSIHQFSPRKPHPIIKVNCAALPANLIESELFGHEKGAFTGAIDKRTGRFEQAHNGTLFLDEIGEMPLEMQSKLLRVLQEKEIERIGGKGTIKVNVRIIAATNRNLEKEVAEGRFRLDLYYRLNVFPIQLPSLRERKEDIGLLTQFFIDHYSRKTGKAVSRIADAALKNLLAWHWPGNIRELENLIERSVLLAKGTVIEDIPLPVAKMVKEEAVRTGWQAKTIEENEREHILAVLQQCNGRIRGAGGAAEILGVPPTTLASKMIKLGIKRTHT